MCVLTLLPCSCLSPPPPLQNPQAKEKVKAKGWTNVHVVEGDACEFRVPEGEAQLVTFSYSLSSESSLRGGGYRTRAP
jgi:hypothetical protein